jgi:hypothetical protein
MFQEALVGKVSPTRVVLRHQRPWFHNSFAPVFIGEFQENGGTAVLEGRFTIPWFVKSVMTFWLGGVCLFLVLASRQIFGNQGPWYEKVIVLIIPLIMLSFGFGFVHLGWWFGRRDIEYISRRIREALLSGGT